MSQILTTKAGEVVQIFVWIRLILAIALLMLAVTVLLIWLVPLAVVGIILAFPVIWSVVTVMQIAENGK